MGAAQQREALRREMLARRDRLPAEERRRLSRAIAERFWGVAEISSARTLHVSLSTGSEVETGDVVAEARRRGLHVVVPVTLVNERRLLLVEFEGIETLAPGPFGIPEPRPEGRKVVDLASVDALVIPGVAFDEHGNRLGWGAGFYDRLLERARPGVPIIALAYECQIVPAVPAEGHDVRMSVMVTEQRVIRVRATSRVAHAERNPPHPPFAKGGRGGIS